MSIELVDTGKRVKKTIDGNNYYITVGEKSLTITCPFENRDDMKKERDVLDELAEAVTIAKGGRVD